MYWSEYNTEFSFANILIQLYPVIFKWILYYWPWIWPYWAETYFIFCWTASLCSLFQIEQTRCTLLLSIVISASLHVSSGELTVSMRHWYFSLCMGGCLVCWLGWVSSQPADQTATHTEWKIPVSHRYSKFSWRWAHNCPKHVENLK